MPISLLQELDWWKKNIGISRSEIIRAGIRMYIKHHREELVDAEKRGLENYHQQKMSKPSCNTHRDENWIPVPEW